MLLIANHNLAKLTVHYNKYEIGKFMVYKFTVHCIVYYSTLDSLQQIVVT